MPQKSAGILLYRNISGRLEVLLAHPGGPFWAQKDEGAWSLPKGEIADGEDPLAAARREFEEETGFAADGEVIPLQPLRQASGKIIHAFAMQKDIDASRVQSNTFDMEWPPRSGKYQAFPEVDRAAWFSLASARSKIAPGQAGFLTQLEAKLGRTPGSPTGA